MKAIVIMPFFDENGLHKVGDVVETTFLNRYLGKYTEKTDKKVEQISEAETQMTKKRIKKNAGESEACFKNNNEYIR